MDLTDARRETLRLLCDTVVPSLERPGDDDGFWRTKATDVGADAALEQLLGVFPAAQQEGLGQLLDVLAEQGFAQRSRLSREQILRNVSLASRDAAAGVQALVGLTLYLSYGLVDERGQNPFFAHFGFPGTQSPPPDVPKPIRPLLPAEDLELEADAVVVGSGAGGGTVAGVLAQRGLKVVVLEQGGYFNEADFPQSELWAHQNLYWRANLAGTVDGNVALQAGACLGGGTVVNWTNSLRTRDAVRVEWAQHGLEDVATPAFDAHLDAVEQRIGVTDACSELNPPQERLRIAAERLGWSFKVVRRNADPEKYTAATAGYMGFGDQSGAKNSVDKTFLLDAVQAGAQVVCGVQAQRVLTEGGRAAGVEAVGIATGASVTVRAPHVVVACGALESPALLLRSGIGGPAVGRHLRLHPCMAVSGDYGEEMRGWWGAPHAGLVDEFAGLREGYGFLIEGVQYTTAITASATHWTSGEEHKAFLDRIRHIGTVIGLTRDRGDANGRVELDDTGQAAPFYEVGSDEVDVANMRDATEMCIRAHVAGGAHMVAVLAAGLPQWRVGDDLEAYIARMRRLPLRAGGVKLFSAHQMGSCRMGADPSTSVADPRGQLHDTPGVWIGDGSAFPTASGTNPMISIMALAHRTATHVAEAAGATGTTSPALAGA